MANDRCKHSWRMTDVHYGFMVVEKCFHCKNERSYFTAEHTPPKEEYREGEHFWNYLGSAQSVKFSLKCSECDLVVPLDEILGLMTCSGCTDDCEINSAVRICERQRIWPYIALLSEAGAKNKQQTAEKLAILSTYFNDRIRTEGKKILVLPGWLIKDPDMCRGSVLEDVGMFEMEVGSTTP